MRKSIYIIGIALIICMTAAVLSACVFADGNTNSAVSISDTDDFSKTNEASGVESHSDVIYTSVGDDTSSDVSTTSDSDTGYDDDTSPVTDISETDPDVSGDEPDDNSEGGNESAASGHTHTYVEQKTTPASCTENGKTEYKCSECGKEYTKTIPAKGHDFGEWLTVVAATVDKEGKAERTCKTCGTKEIKTIARLNDQSHKHEYTKKVVEATCTEEGYTLYTCSCGDSYKQDITPAVGHCMIGMVEGQVVHMGEGFWTVSVRPHLGKPGEEYIDCALCNKRITRPVTVEPLPKEYIQAVFDELNRLRAERGYTPYEWDDRLADFNDYWSGEGAFNANCGHSGTPVPGSGEESIVYARSVNGHKDTTEAAKETAKALLEHAREGFYSESAGRDIIGIGGARIVHDGNYENASYTFVIATDGSKYDREKEIAYGLSDPDFTNSKEISVIRSKWFPVGTRVRLTVRVYDGDMSLMGTMDEDEFLEKYQLFDWTTMQFTGPTGVVTGVDCKGDILVRWDDGTNDKLVYYRDGFVVLK